VLPGWFSPPLQSLFSPAKYPVSVSVRAVNHATAGVRGNQRWRWPKTWVVGLTQEVYSSGGPVVLDAGVSGVAAGVWWGACH
jgi:hypothetical protein